MSFISKLSNWATGVGDSYNHENVTYTNTLHELTTLYQVLDQLTAYQNLLGTSEIEHQKIKRVMELQSEIIVNQRQAANESDPRRVQQLLILYQQLQTLYLQVIEEIKNELLQKQINPRVQSHILEINKQIIQNATLIPFQEYTKERTLNNYWTMDKLYRLQNNIANRQAEIIPKLSKYGR